jgi:cytochrome c oxidase assembly factor CtaG
MRFAGWLMPLHADPGNQPPPLTWLRLLTEWKFDPLFAIPATLGLGLYLWGVLRLRARGDGWPPVRTWSWCVGGIGTASIAGMSALGAYDTVLFSVHMVQHMMLTMITPVFLAIGAPVTLLLRNLGGVGKRRVMRILHSWPLRVLFFPPLATALLITTPFVLYLTAIYRFTLDVDWAHDLLHVYMLTVGCLFFFPILGNDPLPNRLPYPMRLLLLFITMPAQAFLGTTIMGSSRLVAEDWYLAFGRAWPPSPIDDQYYAGAIMWATGDLTMGVIMAVFLAQWYADSKREAVRVDRKLDREERIAAQRAAASRTETNRYDDAGGGRAVAAPDGDDR